VLTIFNTLKYLFLNPALWLRESTNLKFFKPMKTRALILFPLVLMLACTNDDTDPSGRVASFNGTIDTFAGSTFGYDGDGGQAKAAKLGYVTGVTVDAAGNVYITDASANTIRKVNTSNVITTIAGQFAGFNVVTTTFSGDGGPATAAHFNVPWSSVVDASGNIIVSDRGNNLLRKIDGATGIVTTIAGKLIDQGASGDNGPAIQALIGNPEGITSDAAGNLYIADSQNHIIRKISTTGVITTIAGMAGQAGYTGDGGPAISAKLSEPAGIAVDASGNIYFSDNSAVIRRIATSGKIATIAGTGVEGYSGDGGKATEAQLLSPKGIVIAKDGSIVFADSGNNRIRRIAPEQDKIETIAGTGESGYAGDGGLAIDAKMFNPQGLAVDSNGNIYIAESGTGVIRIITWKD
jgi:trimeric autotransporter adhesin